MENITRRAHQRRRGFFGLILGALLFLMVIGLFAGPWLFGGYYGATGPYYYPMPYFGWFFFPFGFFLIFALFFAFRWLWFPWRGGYYYGRWHHHGGAEEIVRERYAKGEITKDQFDQMMRDLQQER